MAMNNKGRKALLTILIIITSCVTYFNLTVYSSRPWLHDIVMMYTAPILFVCGVIFFWVNRKRRKGFLVANLYLIATVVNILPVLMAVAFKMNVRMLAYGVTMVSLIAQLICFVILLKEK